MLSGALYRADDPQLLQGRKNARRLTTLYNNSDDDSLEHRRRTLSELFGALGQNACIEPPFRCDYGYNIFIGDNFFANYDCIVLDVCKVSIGHNVKLGPRVCIYAAEHPLDAEVRNSGLESGKPISIGNDVWIGGNTIINPGISIGNNVVIGSGSVITRNMPDNVVAAGTPCRVIRQISLTDKSYWQNLQQEYIAWSAAINK